MNARPDVLPVYHEGVDNLLFDAYMLQGDLGHRENLSFVSDVINHDRGDPEKFAHLAADFDRVVEHYNALIGVDPHIIPGMDIYPAVKPNIPRLPLMRDALAGEPLVLQETLGNLSTMMRRGDESLGAPDTEWHHWQGDPEAHMVFGIFKIYGELIWREQPKADLDQVLDALIEVMPLALDKDNPVYDAVANAGRLNWLQDGGPFDPAWAATARIEATMPG